MRGFSAHAAEPQETVSIPAENLKRALDDYIKQTGIELIYNTDDVRAGVSHEVRGLAAEKALMEMLVNTGMSAIRDSTGAIIIARSRHDITDPAYAGTESVVVTGTRIVRDNDYAPPPATIVAADQMLRITPSGLPNALNKLPLFAPAQTSISTASGANGKGSRPPGNFMDLRGLGPNRTLVLEDGHRMPATWFDGTIDVNTVPQMLMEQVGIVTGGASAVYGSDAVSGVVNFIIDHKFNGLKGIVEGGVSEYGDASTYRLGLAGGSALFGGRGHVEFSAEVYNRDKVRSQASRPYGNLSTQIVGSGTAASPYRLASNVYISNASFGGLITDGPLAGQQFLPTGKLAPFNPGLPTATINLGIGGDGGWLRNEDLSPSLLTFQSFARADYDLTGAAHFYVQASFAQTRSNVRSQNLVQTAGSNAITIYSGNAFLAPDYQAALTATGTPSFNLNRYDEDFGSRITFVTQTGALAVTTGLTGISSGRYNWEVYFTHGEGRTKQTSLNNVNSERFYAAVDAVAAPAGNALGVAAGTIVCRATLTAPGLYPGCVPIDVFGNGAPSQAAKDYVVGTTWWMARNTMDDFAANITGELFEAWAGPVKAAIGVEYREQGLSETTNVPDNSFNAAGLRGNFSPGTLKWTKDIAAAAQGANSVKESNIEVSMPLLEDLPLVQRLAINGAFRYTDYSTSGDANTWKLGLEWQLLDDLHLRAMQSQDIRAPTLFDLYQGSQVTIVGHQDLLTNSGGSVNVEVHGNPSLVPEVSRNSMAGFTYRPSWLRRFSLSLDYYRISIMHAIGLVSGVSPDVENNCNASGGTSPFCQYIIRPGPVSDTSLANFPILLTSQKLNLASTRAEGVDFELNYATDLGEVDPSLDGVLSLRLWWAHQRMLKTQTLPGAVVLNMAGTAQAPNDRVTLIMNYTRGPFSVDLLERYLASFRQSSNPTLVYAIADVRPYFQTDIDMSWDFSALGHPVTGFLSVANLLNVQGGLYQTSGFSGNPGLNYPVAPGADIFGRYFTLGVRLNMG
ncbi:MAG: TonB-dependent receptor [Alphaproteobacteria bacterium]|nr:TonB-dependent receptor [Alphaproteobacteria bacterium]